MWQWGGMVQRLENTKKEAEDFSPDCPWGPREQRCHGDSFP